MSRVSTGRGSISHSGSYSSSNAGKDFMVIFSCSGPLPHPHPHTTPTPKDEIKKEASLNSINRSCSNPFPMSIAYGWACFLSRWFHQCQECQPEGDPSPIVAVIVLVMRARISWLFSHAADHYPTPPPYHPHAKRWNKKKKQVWIPSTEAAVIHFPCQSPMAEPVSYRGDSISVKSVNRKGIHLP